MSDRVGPYQILETLGEGGMGTVYLAEQKEPVRRRVALKVIKLGMDTKLVLARFEAERQALAIMEHDCIAKVHDAGATEDGRPFFVMEHVKGSPITKYCDAQKLGLQERLDLFRQVCAGIQHAHQKGIIHRDLKPSNVLVTVQGGEPVPKIIDFGLARATNHQLVDQTIYTEQGQVIGTPEYMSPEQAGLGDLDIDTRSDIYALGVLLYELLTGQLPLPDLRERGLLEMQRVIREEDPSKPSTRVSTLHGESDALARSRSLDAGSLARRLRGDLDWIVMKSLEKDRTRRYATADALAEDLRRHLEHEPVEAGPPSAAYRFRKFLRKRRLPISAGAAVFVALIAGLAVAWWQYGVAKDNETRALGAEKEAKQKASELAESVAAYRRMQDVPRAEDLITEANDVLWPAHADTAPAMEDWLKHARALAERAKAHRAKLAELRARALPPTPAVLRRIDQLAALEKERDAKAAKLAKARKASSRSRAARQAVPKLAQELKELDARLTSQRSALRDARWRFEDYEDRFLHTTFDGLVQNIEKLTGGLIAEIAARRERAATLRVRSLEDPKQDWDQAIARIAKNPRYRGMPALTSQLGLVPLGADLDSTLEEFCVLDTGTIPTRNAAGKLAFDGDSAIVLVLIPPGTFWMGAQSSDPSGQNHDPQAHSDELPVHEVTLDAFLLAKHEMTQGQWMRLMGKNPSACGPELFGATLQHPVENVSFDDCTKAMARLGLMLPTEAQWEYAARAGTATPWWSGSDKASLQGVANVADRYCKENGGPASWSYDLDLNDGHILHAPCGSFRANGFGLHNVSGNVREWCRDSYAGYGTAPRPADGGRETAGARFGVFRGGGFGEDARSARSACRGAGWRVLRNNGLGCRPLGVITR